MSSIVTLEGIEFEDPNIIELKGELHNITYEGDYAIGDFIPTSVVYTDPNSLNGVSELGWAAFARAFSKFGKGFKMPKVKIPKVKVPKVKIPKVKIPKIKMPKIKIPKIKMPDLPDMPEENEEEEEQDQNQEEIENSESQDQSQEEIENSEEGQDQDMQNNDELEGIYLDGDEELGFLPALAMATPLISQAMPMLNKVMPGANNPMQMIQQAQKQRQQKRARKNQRRQDLINRVLPQRQPIQRALPQRQPVQNFAQRQPVQLQTKSNGSVNLRSEPTDANPKSEPFYKTPIGIGAIAVGGFLLYSNFKKGRK